MVPQLVDSHCHLNLLSAVRHGADVREVIAEAANEGIGHLLCVSVELDDSPLLRAYAQRFPQVFISAGLHPNHDAKKEPDEAAIVAVAAAPEVVAIGETGLDYFRSEGDLAWQQERFRRHIRVARTLKKPLIIHSREARKDTLRILREERAGEVGGVMHCFVEDWDTARDALELGFYISFSGIVTYKNAEQVQHAAARVPLDRLLVETDSPYLAPVPRRGRENHPGFVHFVAEYLATLRDMEIEALSAATTDNFFRLFQHAARI